MRFKIVSSLVAATALLPFMAQAADLSYSYVDLAYINTDVDHFDESVDGFALRGSLELTDQVFLFAGYTDQSTSIFGDNLDLQTFRLGAGYAWPIAPSLDVYGKVGYARAEAKYPGPDFSDDGYSLGVGLRGRAAAQLELEGSIDYTDLSDAGDDTALNLAARWFFTPQFAAGVEGEFSNDADTYGIGLRWNFGK
jgi:hypothetical protein